MIRQLLTLLLKVSFVIAPDASVALSEGQTFRFESLDSIEQMTDFLREAAPLRSRRHDIRKLLVDYGGATRIKHPSRLGVEKYIYDIDLCSLYIWRWNISADYDVNQRLMQLYVNGRPILPNGKAPQKISKEARPGVQQSILKGYRERPQAYKGESRLTFLMFDGDSNLKTIDDQELVGAGPSRPHPHAMGSMTVYREVDPWRSIFDADPARKIVRYSGNCGGQSARG